MESTDLVNLEKHEDDQSKSQSPKAPPSSRNGKYFDKESAERMIDSLRRRLLAERSASKSAKEYVQHYSKRIEELEEMVKTEMEKKDKAEKAMKEAIARLKSAGISTENIEAQLGLEQGAQNNKSSSDHSSQHIFESEKKQNFENDSNSESNTSTENAISEQQQEEETISSSQLQSNESRDTSNSVETEVTNEDTREQKGDDNGGNFSSDEKSIEENRDPSKQDSVDGSKSCDASSIKDESLRCEVEERHETVSNKSEPVEYEKHIEVERHETVSNKSEPVEYEKHIEVLRSKLHELVDQIVTDAGATSEHKCAMAKSSSSASENGSSVGHVEKGREIIIDNSVFNSKSLSDYMSNKRMQDNMHCCKRSDSSGVLSSSNHANIYPFQTSPNNKPQSFNSKVLAWNSFQEGTNKKSSSSLKESEGVRSFGSLHDTSYSSGVHFHPQELLDTKLPSNVSRRMKLGSTMLTRGEDENILSALRVAKSRIQNSLDLVRQSKRERHVT